MIEKLQQLRLIGERMLQDVTSLAALEQVRIELLGRRSELYGILRQMGGLSPEERKEVGQQANDLRAHLEHQIEEKAAALSASALDVRLAQERIDVTLPGEMPPVGGRHPVNLVLDEVKEIFIGMGYEIADGPEVEYDKYNFEMLNLPREHPARDTQDTFYITENVLLRTQTSPVQVRVMLAQKPPIRIIAPGRVYRVDEVDATHYPCFHQIEGLVVDKGVGLGDMKTSIEILARRLYGEDVVLRFRPSHFPFTEPSAEVDMRCFKCHGARCSLCKHTGWIEAMGCGMVNPKVLAMCGIDPEVYSGWAFGIGTERLAMRRFQIDDLRLFYDNDLRFLRQFA